MTTTLSPLSDDSTFHCRVCGGVTMLRTDGFVAKHRPLGAPRTDPLCEGSERRPAEDPPCLSPDCTGRRVVLMGGPLPQPAKGAYRETLVCENTRHHAEASDWIKAGTGYPGVFLDDEGQPLKASDFNRYASFQPMSEDDENTRPLLMVGGVCVFGYVDHDGTVRVSIDLDTVAPKLVDAETETVPLDITVQGASVFRSTRDAPATVRTPDEQFGRWLLALAKGVEEEDGSWPGGDIVDAITETLQRECGISAEEIEARRIDPDDLMEHMPLGQVVRVFPRGLVSAQDGDDYAPKLDPITGPDAPEGWRILNNRNLARTILASPGLYVTLAQPDPEEADETGTEGWVVATNRPVTGSKEG